MLRSLFKNPIIYKVLVDVFFCMLIFTFAYIISEAILPGIVSALISPFYLFSLLFLCAIIIAFVGKKQDHFFAHKNIQKWILAIAFLFAGALFIIAGVRYGIAYDIIIAVLSLATTFFFYKAFKEKIQR